MPYCRNLQRPSTCDSILFVYLVLKPPLVQQFPLVSRRIQASFQLNRITQLVVRYRIVISRFDSPGPQGARSSSVDDEFHLPLQAFCEAKSCLFAFITMWAATGELLSIPALQCRSTGFGSSVNAS